MKTKLIGGALVVAALAALGFAFHEQLALENLAAQEQRLREAIRRAPWQAFFVGLAVYYGASLVPGTSGKAIVFGWLFGIAQGVVLVSAALTLAALTTFTLCRYFLRDVVESRFAIFQRRLNAALERDGVFILLTMRMFHVPYSLLNYVCGVCRVSTATFAWTTALGMLPGTCVFVFLGANLPTLNEIATDGVKHLLSPWLWIALLATGLLPWVVRALSRAWSGVASDPSKSPAIHH